jgi:hypothetical protein
MKRASFARPTVYPAHRPCSRVQHLSRCGLAELRLRKKRPLLIHSVMSSINLAVASPDLHETACPRDTVPVAFLLPESGWDLRRAG